MNPCVSFRDCVFYPSIVWASLLGQRAATPRQKTLLDRTRPASPPHLKLARLSIYRLARKRHSTADITSDCRRTSVPPLRPRFHGWPCTASLAGPANSPASGVLRPRHVTVMTVRSHVTPGAPSCRWRDPTFAAGTYSDSSLRTSHPPFWVPDPAPPRFLRLLATGVAQGTNAITAP